MLNGTLTLHDIRDTEAFCASIIRKTRLDLTTDQHERLLTYLVEEAWILSTRYNANGRPARFSVIATERLRQRITDWLRTNIEDRRYQRRFTLTTLDDQLEDTLTASPLDDPAHSDPDLLRILRNRDRTHDRPYPTLDRKSARRAA